MTAGPIGVSVVIPCLDEEATIGACVRSAWDGIHAAGVDGEVIVVDNGSADRSAELAQAAGAVVVREAARGYGSAYLAGMRRARGEWILMGDGDGTYDFGELPRFLAAGRDADMVMGSRLLGRILPGAMPWHHRYIGNPVLTGMLNLLFGAGVSDAHCGLRMVRREAADRIGLRTTGMEFASEMIIQAARAGLVIAETPITYGARPDGSHSKLRSVPDGLRHVRFMLACASGALIWVPAAVLVAAGAACSVVADRPDRGRRRGARLDRRDARAGGAHGARLPAARARAPPPHGACAVAAAAARARGGGARRGERDGRRRGPARPAPASGDDLPDPPPPAVTSAPGERRSRPPPRWWRGHRLFAALLVAAAGLRVVVQLAYAPALFFYGDSFAYLANAAKLQPEPIRPAGYPALLLRACFIVHDLAVVPAVQHVLRTRHRRARLCARPPPRRRSGRCVHRGRAGAVRRLPARHRAAHPVGGASSRCSLPPGWSCCCGGRGPSIAACAVTGVLLAAAALTRSVGLALIAPALAFAIVRGGLVRSLVLAAAFALPLVGYATWYSTTPQGRFALTDHDGFFLYGRVGDFASCSGIAAHPGRAPCAVRSASARRPPESQLLRVAPVVAAPLPGIPAPCASPGTACSSPSRSP